jgi:TolA-binding protein
MRCRHLVFLASFSFALLVGLATANGVFCLTSRDLPAADLPTANTTPAVASSPTSGAAPSPTNAEANRNQNHVGPEPSPEAASGDDMSQGKPLGDDRGSLDLENEQGIGTAATQAAAEATPPPPALEAGGLAVSREFGNQSLDPEINKAIAPALVASLRLTESARKLLVDGEVDNAMRDLSRAVSLDPSDAFAYYYLGRAYLARNNYTQALTFFRRAEIGFNGRADWTAEALSYEGLCDEELGKTADAAQAYERALAAWPNNFQARVGFGRLASFASPSENADSQPPNQDLAFPPPSAPAESAPPEQPPPPPPE